jgi:hypothetical protein
MPTTRRRVNLTLTEMEQRVLGAIVTAGTPEHDAFVRHVRPGQPDDQGSDVPVLGLADVVHVVLRMGLAQLEIETAEASYAAEAGVHDEAARASTMALRRRLAASATRTDG